jgi:hypothetical protein
MGNLVSDRGKEFANAILDNLCEFMNVNYHIVTPYHPQSNGQVERFNWVMKNITMLDVTTN